jgi:hypothetical protein
MGVAMPFHVVSRRAALSALGLAILGPSVAGAQGPPKFRDVRVDVTPLRAQVGDPTAAWVEQMLPVELARALGPYLAPGDRNGARLVARIDFIYLGPSSGGTGPLGASQDTIAGTLFVQGPRGSAPAEIPLRAIASYYRNPFDQALVEQAYHDRVFALSQSFAYWVPGKLGL